MAVSFLTTPVKAPDEDDWGKLVRVLTYINGTWYMKLILSADETNFTVHWYVDGSLAGNVVFSDVVRSWF